MGGQGLRQPIHADDMTYAVVRASEHTDLSQSTYNIGGGERLSVKDMVRRAAAANGLGVFFVSVPLPLARAGLTTVSVFPQFRGIPKGSLERMRRDMVFDNNAAYRDFEFPPPPVPLSLRVTRPKEPSSDV